ncbi:MAG: hypothetical protein P8Z00_00085 [Anaerolineales bacterium]|jgi:hypothetical protein
MGEFQKTRERQEEAGSQKRIESLLPAIPMLYLLFIFLAADFYPCVSAEQAGLVWQECRLAADTYTDVPNQEQAERCFGQPAPSLAPGEREVSVQDVTKPGLVGLAQPYQMDGKLISIGKLGVKYFLMVDGRRVGPVFDDILVGENDEYVPFSVNYGHGRYVFRGARHGAYYLVEVSSSAILTGQ